MAHTVSLIVFFSLALGWGVGARAQENATDFKQIPEDSRANDAGGDKPAAGKINYAPDPLRGFVKAKILTNGALVYKLADFDSPVLGKVAAGKTFMIFPKVIGPFYRIRVGAVFGYIADNDVQIVAPSAASATPAAKKAARETEKSKDLAESRATVKKKKPLSRERMLGLEVMDVNYAENVLGGHHSQTRTAFGLKLSGPDIALGAADTEINLDYSSGAPSYYSSPTSSADGFIFFTDLQVLSVKDLNKFMASYFGLGPMLRFSHYLLENQVPGKATSTNSVVDSLNLGLVASLGLGIRLGPVTLRPEFRFQWEKQTYWSSGITLMTEF